MPSQENPHRNEKTLHELTRLTSDYIQRTSSAQSLITITNAQISRDRSYVTFYISILPKEETRPALRFLEKHTRELRQTIKKNGRMRRIPFIKFVVDEGELHRQHMDTVFEENKPE